MTSDLSRPSTIIAPDLLAAAPIGVLAIDEAGRISSANPAACALLGQPESRLIGAPAHDRLHGPDKLAGCPLEAPLRTGRVAGQDSDTFRRSGAGLIPVRWTAAPLPAPTGGAVIVFSDDTERRARSVTDTAEHEQRSADLAVAEQSVSDLEWVAEATEVLSSTLDEREVLMRLARLAVTRIADVAVVDEVIDRDVVHRLGGAKAVGVDVDLDALLASGRATRGLSTEAATYATATTRQIARLTAADLHDPGLLSPSSRELLLAVDAEHVLLVPLAARNHVVGVIGFVRRAGRGSFDDVDVLIATDLCRRAALALDNARLYRAQADIALQLQKALLPASIDGAVVRAAVRYLPANDHFEVGGDWYDLFTSPAQPETNVLLIGDVAGHDLHAATTMAAVRNLLRGVGVATDCSPAQVITAVDTNLDALGVVGTASTIVMTATPAGPHQWSLTWSNAGHLPPVLITPAGTVELLAELHGPILGARSRQLRRQSTRTVAAGSTVVLYTDGLVETRDESIDAGLTRLATSAAQAAAHASDPERLADELVATNRLSDEDDMAILVCHLPANS